MARGLFHLREPVSRSVALTVSCIGVITVISAWCIAAYVTQVNPLFVPAPDAVWNRAVDLWQRDVLFQDIWVSNVRVLVGFFLAAAVGVPIGMLCGTYRTISALVDPLLGFLRYLPVPAFIPLLILYCGIDETPKILLIFIGVVVQIATMVADASRQVSDDYLKVARVLGATEGEMFRKVLLRGAAPGILDALRVNLGFAWTYLVVAELVAANSGLGARIIKSQRFLQTDTIFLYLLIIGVIGIVCDQLLAQLHRRWYPWALPEVRR